MPDTNDSIRAALRENMQLELRARALRQAINLAADPGAVAERFRSELTEIENKLSELQAKPIVLDSVDKIDKKKPPAKPKSATRGGSSPSAFDFSAITKGPGFEGIATSRSGGRTVGELARGVGIRTDSVTRSVRSNSGPSKLGAETTGLDARYDIRMAPVPTGVYHLLNSDENPLVEVTVKCVSLPRERKAARIFVQAYIEGLSANHVKTFELEKNEEKSIRLLPTLLPDKVRFITEVQRATLHVIVEDLDGSTELHDSVTVSMLARNSGLNAMIDPVTKKTTDLTRYYGAWVTPHAEPILKLLRQAAEKTNDKTISGYLTGKTKDVTDQAKALFDTLKNEHKITYINSVIDFGAGASYFSQRARLPRESIDQMSANCLDGTLLFASLLEAAALKPAIVLFPGHALVAWQNTDVDSDDNSNQAILKGWTFLETTVIGGKSFEEAVKFGSRQVEFEIGKPDFLMHKLMDLRLAGIFPME